MIKATIFDVDGTMVDSVDLHAKAWVEAFAHFGKAVSFHDVRRQIGKGADQLLPVFLSKDELAAFGAELDKYRSRLFKAQYLPQVRGFPAVRELFKRIKDDGKQIALASSAKAYELDAYKKIAQVDDLVTSETSADDAEKSKPYPDVFQAALAGLDDTAPENAIVLGDTPYDAEAAARAGLPTVGFLCGGWSEEELRRAGCVAIYRDPKDLLDRYGQSPLAPTR